MLVEKLGSMGRAKKKMGDFFVLCPFCVYMLLLKQRGVIYYLHIS